MIPVVSTPVPANSLRAVLRGVFVFALVCVPSAASPPQMFALSDKDEFDRDFSEAIVLHSPDRKLEVHIEPGPGQTVWSVRYRWARDGKELANVVKPFLLRHSVVTNDGVVVGLVFQTIYGPHEDRSIASHLRFVILDSAGRERTNVAWERHQGDTEGLRVVWSPFPRPMEVMVDPDNDRVLLHVVELSSTDERHDVWHAIRLTTGAILARFEPRPWPPEQFLRVESCQCVEGTPLVLVQWTNGVSATRDTNVRYTVMDETGRTVWKHDVGARPVHYASVSSEALGPRITIHYLGLGMGSESFDVRHGRYGEWDFVESAGARKADRVPANCRPSESGQIGRGQR